MEKDELKDICVGNPPTSEKVDGEIFVVKEKDVSTESRSENSPGTINQEDKTLDIREKDQKEQFGNVTSPVTENLEGNKVAIKKKDEAEKLGGVESVEPKTLEEKPQNIKGKDPFGLPCDLKSSTNGNLERNISDFKEKDQTGKQVELEAPKDSVLNGETIFILENTQNESLVDTILDGETVSIPDKKQTESLVDVVQDGERVFILEIERTESLVDIKFRSKGTLEGETLNLNEKNHIQQLGSPKPQSIEKLKGEALVAEVNEQVDQIREVQSGNTNLQRESASTEIDSLKDQPVEMQSPVCGGEMVGREAENQMQKEQELKSLTSENLEKTKHDADRKYHGGQSEEVSISKVDEKITSENEEALAEYIIQSCKLDLNPQEEKITKTTDKVISEDKEAEPVLDGTDIPGVEFRRSSSTTSLGIDEDSEGFALAGKAVSLKNFVREKSTVAVSALRPISGKGDEDGLDDSSGDVNDDKELENNNEVVDFCKESEDEEASQKTLGSSWNPFSFIKLSRDTDAGKMDESLEGVTEEQLPPVMKGRIMLYTKLGCQGCKETRSFLRQRGLGYVEINIDIYPTRKLELEKISGSSAVPKVLFNEVLIGGLNELISLGKSGKLAEKIEYVISEAPSFEAPIPPLSGEDDPSSCGSVDELAEVVKKMREYIVVKDRFHRMRIFTNCFLGTDAVSFISKDQFLEREEAVQFGRKLANQLFFHNVLEENIFEDGNHLYRFLDHDPLVMSQCQNIPKGIISVKTKPIAEIASRLRFLSYAILEAYASEDGVHVDYRSIHGSEEFARYLRVVEQLQRVELVDMSREEKLAFFINLYNMMAIHAILVLGHPAGAMERRKLFCDFKYVIGGCTYSLSAIQNGILRGNQRPPYNLVKPFGVKDKRSKVALPYPEPLIHFALVHGSRSGPALRCYSPGNIDIELNDAACNFIRNGGLVVDFNGKSASASKILNWFSADFGKSEVEVLKHAANYLEPADSEAFLEMLADTQLKVVYQPYDWSVNC